MDDRSAAESSALRRVDRLWTIALFVAIILAWQAVGGSSTGTWTSSPAAVASRLWVWAQDDLWLNIGITLFEMAFGLAIGLPLGVGFGILLGRTRLLAILLQPIIVALYNIPMITVAPLLILWFGLGLTPKVVLVALVTFFLMFFSTFMGARSIDPDLMMTLKLMGANRRERFVKMILPASAAWIMSGLKIALPYALIDAIVGEMLAAERGLGHLLTTAVGQIDMTGVYAVLVILMIIGVGVVALASRLESVLLHWRPVHA